MKNESVIVSKIFNWNICFHLTFYDVMRLVMITILQDLLSNGIYQYLDDIYRHRADIYRRWANIFRVMTCMLIILSCLRSICMHPRKGGQGACSLSHIERVGKCSHIMARLLVALDSKAVKFWQLFRDTIFFIINLYNSNSVHVREGAVGAQIRKWWCSCIRARNKQMR